MHNFLPSSRLIWKTVVVVLSLCVLYLGIYVVFAPPYEATPLPDSVPDITINLNQPGAYLIAEAKAVASGSVDVLTTRRDLRLRSADEPAVLATKTLLLAHFDPWALRSIYLSGDTRGDEYWTIDGILLLEAFIEESVYSRAVVGKLDGLTMSNGDFITRLGRKTNRFSPREINIMSLIPKGQTIFLRVSALTTEDGGLLSDLFVVVE